MEDVLKDRYDIKVSWRGDTRHTLRELGADEPYQCVSIGTCVTVQFSECGIHMQY